MDFFSYLSIPLSLLALFVAIYQYIVSKRNLNFEAMNRCLSDFEKCFDNEWNFKKDALPNYIELVNRELFYFQHNYLPIEIAYEWIDGILNYLPFVNKSIKHKDSKEILSCLPKFSIIDSQSYINYTQNKLEGYDRIKMAFNYESIKNKEELHKILQKFGNTRERLRLVKQVLKNIGALKRINITKHLKLNKELKFSSLENISFKKRMKFLFETW